MNTSYQEKLSQWLYSKEYRDVLKHSHPFLGIDDHRLQIAPSFITSLKSIEAIRPGKIRTLYKYLAELLPNIVSPKSLFIGTPFEPYDQEQLLKKILNPQELLKRAQLAAQKEQCALIIIPNIPKESQLIKHYQNLGFIAFPSFPDTVLTLEHTFEQQLSKIPQKDRNGIRRNIKRFNKAGHQLHQVQSTETWSDDFINQFAEAIYTCYCPFFGRAKVKWLRHSVSYFKNLLSHPKHLSFTYATNTEHELIGFIINFKDKNSFQAGRIGVHPKYHHQDAVYFRLLYHVIEEAIQQDCAYISLEPTSYRFKRHLGAQKKMMCNLLYPTSKRNYQALKYLKPMADSLLKHLNHELLLDQLY